MQIKKCITSSTQLKMNCPIECLLFHQIPFNDSSGAILNHWILLFCETLELYFVVLEIKKLYAKNPIQRLHWTGCNLLYTPPDTIIGLSSRASHDLCISLMWMLSHIGIYNTPHFNIFLETGQNREMHPPACSLVIPLSVYEISEKEWTFKKNICFLLNVKEIFVFLIIYHKL